MVKKPIAVRFVIDRQGGRSFYEQVRDQLINLAHFGGLAAGERLPTVRALARNAGISLKTAFKIYQMLARAGLVEIRPQSGIFMRSAGGGLEEAYRRSVREFLKRVKAEAGRLNLTPRRLAHLLAVEQGDDGKAEVTCAVLECNREQTRLFAAEIERKLQVRAVPLEVFSFRPPAHAGKALRDADFLITTDFHWEEGMRMARRLRKKILRLRLNPGFLAMILAAARKGPFTMILTDTAYQDRFRKALEPYLKPRELDRIRVLHYSDRKAIRETTGGRVYVSPLCETRVLPLLGDHVRRVRHDNMIAGDSLRELQESLLFYPFRRK